MAKATTPKQPAPPAPKAVPQPAPAPAPGRSAAPQVVSSVDRDGATSADQARIAEIIAQGAITDPASTQPQNVDELLQEAKATAALKALLAGATVTSSGALVAKDGGLTKAQFQAAVQQVLGRDATPDGDSQRARALKRVLAGLDVAADGSLHLKEGVASKTLQAQLQTLVGEHVLISNDRVVLGDQGLPTATLEKEVEAAFGPEASLGGTLKASRDANGRKSAEAMAGYKALVANTTIDTSGDGITITNADLKLTRSQFNSALASVFGENAKLDDRGSLIWKSEGRVGAERTSAFKAALENIDVDLNGELTVKDGRFSGAVGADIRAVFGSAVIVADNKLLFADDGFMELRLNNQLTAKFGKNASLDATLEASIDASGIRSAAAMVGFKALVGGATIDTSGTGIRITNNKLTEAQFQAAVTSVFGKNGQFTGTGRVTWTADAGLDAELTAAFKATYGSLDIDASGGLRVKDGRVSGYLQANIQKVFGTATFVSNNNIVLDDAGFVNADLNAQLKKTFGDHGSIEATVNASIVENHLAQATVAVSAWRRLKELQNGGHIDIDGSATVTIKDGAIDRAEVSALLSVATGKNVNLSTGGRLLYENGALTPELTANLSAAWKNTTLDANGTLRIVDGRPEITGRIRAMFGGDVVKAGGTLEITGADSGSVGLQLSRLGASADLDAQGSLHWEHGRITGAEFTTNILAGADKATNIGLNGMVVVNDAQTAAKLEASITAGAFKASAGVTANSQVQLYAPNESDSSRREIAAKGGFWSDRTSDFSIQGGAGASLPVEFGGAQLKLGFEASASKTRSVRTLTIHGNEADALSKPPFLVTKPFSTVADVMRMRPYEQVSETGTQAIGLGGNVSVGYGLGPAAITVGGEIYYQVTGAMTRDVERLDGTRVRVRFSTQDKKTNVRAVSAHAGLVAGALPKVVANFAPLVEQVARVGFEAKWSDLKQNDTVFDVTIDTATPQGFAALQHALNNDLSEAQYWAQYQNSGVVLGSSVSTQIRASSKETSITVGPFTQQTVSRWLEQKTRTATPESLTIHSAVDRRVVNDPFFSWNATKTTDVRFVHEIAKKKSGPLPDVSEAPAQGVLAARTPAPLEAAYAPTLDDVRSLLGVRIRLEDPQTSLRDLQNTVGPAAATMELLGVQPKQLDPIDDLQDHLKAGIAPPRKPMIEMLDLGDQRFDATAVDLIAYLPQQGLETVLGGADGRTPRSKQEYYQAYLDAAKAAGDTALNVPSRAGLFSSRMMRLSELYQASLSPKRSAGETDAAFQTRMDHYQSTSLYRRPDEYFEQMDGLMREIIAQDGSTGTNAALAMLRMAGPETLYARAWVEMPPEAMDGIQSAARANVQKFGAMAVLAQEGAKLRGDELVVPHASRAADVQAAAKVLLGDKASVATDGGSIRIRGWQSLPTDTRSATEQFFQGVVAKDGTLIPPPSWSPEMTRRILSQALGGAAAVDGGRIVFDNRDYDLIDVGAAVNEAFSPESFKGRFPTMVPIQQGGGFTTDKYGFISARHVGDDSNWGSEFASIGYLRGRNADLLQPEVRQDDWLLK